jgi:hypothetical protein
MPYVEHRAPRMPGEELLLHPPHTDPRCAPFFDNLKRLGVLDEFYVARRTVRFLRLAKGDTYIWKCYWKE